jgi:clathrin heavy chain
MIAINKAGQIFAIDVDGDNLVKFITNANHIPDNKKVAFNLASRFGLGGADETFVNQFNMLLAQSDYAGAARVAKAAPGDLLRNMETINKFKSLAPQPGSTQQPIMLYFSTLLDSGVQLNAIESVALAQPVLAAGKTQLVEQWMSGNKLTMSDQLGELIRQHNPQLALKVFQSAGSPDKVIQGLIETNQFDKIMPYCQKTNYTPDWLKILRAIILTNPQAASNLAKMITARDANGNPKTPIDGVLQIFREHSRIQEATAFLLEALKGNRPDEGHLQTLLFEINLASAPNIAEGIFQLNLFTHYDKEKVARMCEQVALYARALQNYSNIEDCKRVMLNSHVIPKEIMLSSLAESVRRSA